MLAFGQNEASNESIEEEDEEGQSHHEEEKSFDDSHKSEKWVMNDDGFVFLHKNHSVTMSKR